MVLSGECRSVDGTLEDQCLLIAPRLKAGYIYINSTDQSTLFINSKNFSDGSRIDEDEITIVNSSVVPEYPLP